MREDSDLPDEFRIEPELALAAGSDGLKLVRRISPMRRIICQKMRC